MSTSTWLARQRWWLACGVLAPALYVSMTVLVGRAWQGYSVGSQTISEISAIGAPTRPLWLGLIAIYSVLMIAFGLALLRSAISNRASRAVGALLAAQTMFGVFWPPMHQRVVLAASGRTMTDTLHIVWTIVTSVVFMVALGFGAAALGKRFRAYSLVTLIVVLASGMLTGTYAARMEANLPTPWVGVWERINTTAFMAWVAVFAVSVWRQRSTANAVASAGERSAPRPI
jgi:hypothetical protein